MAYVSWFCSNGRNVFPRFLKLNNTHFYYLKIRVSVIVFLAKVLKNHEKLFFFVVVVVLKNLFFNFKKLNLYLKYFIYTINIKTRYHKYNK